MQKLQKLGNDQDRPCNLPVKWWNYLLILITVAGPTQSSRILLHPYGHCFNSRLVNMNKLAVLLHQHGHEPTIILPSQYTTFPTKIDSRVKVVSYEVPEPDANHLCDDQKMVYFMLHDPIKLMTLIQELHLTYCEYLIKSPDLLTSLKASQYDLLIADCAENCAPILIQYLDIPTMLYSNFGYFYLPNVFYPTNPSFVPSSNFGFTDEMTFTQRLGNALERLLMVYISRYWFNSPFTELRDKYNLNTSLAITDAFRQSTVTIVNAHYAFDFPRPYMPHIVPVAGVFLAPHKPLELTLKQFMQSSGEDGVIIVSFGSILANISERYANAFANVFSKLPQKVVWSYNGILKWPDKTNILTLPWIPQNDLLGHPNVKLFITHCGVSASYEAIFNARPVVAIPVMGDQFHNAAKLVHRVKMGVHLDYHGNMNEEQITAAIQTVLSNQQYARNAEKASKLIRDNPVGPKETFLYWVNFTIRHSGPLHLQSEAAHVLTWYQYLLLDVLVVIISSCIVLLVVGYLLIKCAKYLAVQLLFSIKHKYKKKVQ